MQPATNDVPARILAAATRRMARSGYEGTSLRAIAEDVGIRAPSLLHHFGSKEALREAVLDDLLAGWKDLVPAVLRAATTGRDRFDGVLGLLIGFFGAEPDRARLLVREALDRPEAIRALVAVHLSPFLPLLTEWIERGRDEGRVHSTVDPAAYVAEVVLLVLGHVALGEVADPLGGAPDPAFAARRDIELRRLCNAALYRTRPGGHDG